MATSEEYIVFVCERIRGAYDVRYKKMFGEYMVYVNEKPVLLVCDNCVFVKKLPETERILRNADTGIPYGGAKEHFILDIENETIVDETIALLERITPIPQKRKKK